MLRQVEYQHNREDIKRTYLLQHEIVDLSQPLNISGMNCPLIMHGVQSRAQKHHLKGPLFIGSLLSQGWSLVKRVSMHTGCIVAKHWHDDFHQLPNTLCLCDLPSHLGHKDRCGMSFYQPSNYLPHVCWQQFNSGTEKYTSSCWLKRLPSTHYQLMANTCVEAIKKGCCTKQCLNWWTAGLQECIWFKVKRTTSSMAVWHWELCKRCICTTRVSGFASMPWVLSMQVELC